MTAAGALVLGFLAWFLGAAVAAVFIGRLIRNADRDLTPKT